MNCAGADRSSKLEKFCRIDSAKKRWRLQVALEAMAVNEGTQVATKQFMA